MDKTIAGLLGAAATLTTINSAQAATSQTTVLAPAASYRDLLEPIPNALSLLKAETSRGTEAPTAGKTRLAQQDHHHHHHHHHHVVPRVIRQILPVRHHHHHHHHHHHDHDHD